jgi:hypothetical protein
VSTKRHSSPTAIEPLNLPFLISTTQSIKNIRSIQTITMRFSTLSIAVLATASSAVLAAEPELKIEVTRAVECERKTQRGDSVDVHYRGSLQSDGTEFDASYNRGSPLSFAVGTGQVIKGCVSIAVLLPCRKCSV